MTRRQRCLSILVGALFVGACGVDRADDQFARTFVARLHARDSSGFAQLEPGGELARDGWGKIAATAKYLPDGQLDSVRLLSWERGKNHHGPYRKLTYHVAAAQNWANIDIWLSTTGGRTYVNTVQISGPPEGAPSSR